MSTTYTATATREGRWWVLEVEGVGATQVRALRDAAAEVADMVAITLDVPVEDVVVEVNPALDPALLDEVATARRSVSMLKIAQSEAAHQSREAARKLERAGLTRADVAAVLEVSPQRVSQLLAGHDMSDVGAAKAARGRKNTSALAS